MTFDGNARIITLDTSQSFAASDIYDAAKDWEAQAGNMQFPSPMDAKGNAALGAGIYTDKIFVLTNGWKLKPAGYAPGAILVVSGTLITDDGSALTVPPTSGSPVTWQFKSTTAATIVTVSSGSGLSEAQDEALASILDRVNAIPADPTGVTLDELAAVPDATPTLRQALMLLYMAMRNKTVTSSAELKLHNDAGAEVASSALSDDGRVFTRDRLQSA